MLGRLVGLVAARALLLLAARARDQVVEALGRYRWQVQRRREALQIINNKLIICNSCSSREESIRDPTDMGRRPVGRLRNRWKDVVENVERSK